jgi:hypothetical protein
MVGIREGTGRDSTRKFSICEIEQVAVMQRSRDTFEIVKRFTMTELSHCEATLQTGNIRGDRQSVDIAECRTGTLVVHLSEKVA